MPTMEIEQGKCEIYPDKPTQMCMRLKVLVIPMRPKGDHPCPIGAEADDGWVADLTKDEPLLDVTVRCGQAGVDRLRKGIDSAVAPPTPRPRKPNVMEMPTIEAAS